MAHGQLPPGVHDLLEFPLVEALLGRRSRRFFRGAEIPDGVFAYQSRHPAQPLSELETLLVVTACGGNTGFCAATPSIRRAGTRRGRAPSRASAAPAPTTGG
jgi:hypothetical protein